MSMDLITREIVGLARLGDRSGPGGSGRRRTDRPTEELSRLPSKDIFAEYLAEALGDPAAGAVAVLHLDLHRFKEVNEAHGEATGDRLMSRVSYRLGQAVDEVCRGGRVRPTLARAGSDEFLVLAEGLEDPGDAAGVASSLLEALRRPFLVDGRSFHLAAVVGIATRPPAGSRARDLLRQAETAMAHAQAAGRWSCRFHCEEMNRAMRRRLELEDGLRRALTTGEGLRVVYQPIVEAATGRKTSVEALLRWTSPELGEVSPSEFVPVAEESGLMLRLGEWVLETACAQLRAWDDDGQPPLEMAVNLSLAQLRVATFPDVVQRILRRHRLNPARLTLEITERGVAGDDGVVVASLERLAKSGVRLAVDDFGVGNSAFRYLRALAISTVKIDRSFVVGAVEDLRGRAILSGVVTMAERLGAAVVAEGIETEEQARLLAGLGCDRLQGFHLALPGPPEAAVADLGPPVGFRRRAESRRPGPVERLLGWFAALTGPGSAPRAWSPAWASPSDPPSSGAPVRRSDVRR